MQLERLTLHQIQWHLLEATANFRNYFQIETREVSPVPDWKNVKNLPTPFIVSREKKNMHIWTNLHFTTITIYFSLEQVSIQTLISIQMEQT